MALDHRRGPRAGPLSQGADALALVGDRVLARHAAAVLFPARLSAARQPDRHHRAVRALARPHPRLCRHRLARPRGLLRHRRLYRRHLLQAGVGRALHRPDRRHRRRRAARLRVQLRDRALPPSHADHDHARSRPAAGAGGQQRELAHRRQRRPAGHHHLAAARHVRIRSVGLYRLQLFADRAVHRVPRRAAADPFAVRAGAARHPRERRAHAGDRRAEPQTYPHHLYPLRRHGRHRRRASWRRPRKRWRSMRSASSARPTCW